MLLILVLGGLNDLGDPGIDGAGLYALVVSEHLLRLGEPASEGSSSLAVAVDHAVGDLQVVVLNDMQTPV
jgi:hypothetical protein